MTSGETKPTSTSCPSCGNDVRASARFCDACGTRLETEAAAPAPDQAQEAERRQLTVLFCDLVGSTELSERIDPEELRALVRGYQTTCARVIKRYDGHIAQYLGDGLLVYFGYPVAHEEDARRAVGSALEILEEMSRSNSGADIELAVRIGVHTGEVVVGEIGGGDRREFLALGDTPNLAARLQGLAEANTAVVSKVTYRLIEGFFSCEQLGSFTLKGFAEPMPVYRVVSATAARDRLDVAPAGGWTPLVGREGDLEALVQRWEEAAAGSGHVALISGEAGIGKSRLSKAVSVQASTDDRAGVYELGCGLQHQLSALYPVTQWLSTTALGFERGDSDDSRMSKLEKLARDRELDLEEDVPLLASLLSVPLGDDRGPIQLTPALQKERTLELLVRILCSAGEGSRVLLAIEDLHWVDSATLELLDRIVERASSLPLLVVFTFRPTFTPTWGDQPHVSRVSLDRIDGDSATRMIAWLTGGRSLPPEVQERLLARADGIPLFIEELAKTVLESEALRAVDDHYELRGGIDALSIPVTLKDLLMARLDRLGPAKEVAQLAATLGREFSLDLLNAISPQEEPELERQLDRLERADMLLRHGQPPEVAFEFRHALIQEAAYESLLRRSRQKYHERIGWTLKTEYAETLETEPEVVAHHFTAGDVPEQAIPCWKKAGQLAIGRSAQKVAIDHLTIALQLLEKLPPSDDRDRQELEIQAALGPTWMAFEGWTSEKAERALSRANKLCRGLGLTAENFPVLLGIWHFQETRGELTTARRLAEELAALADEIGDPALVPAAQRAMGETLYWLGDQQRAWHHIERGINAHDPSYDYPGFQYEMDAGMACNGVGSFILWILGYPERSMALARKALDKAQETGHPFRVAWATFIVAIQYAYRSDYATTLELTEASLAISAKHGFQQMTALASMHRGWALAHLGEPAEGISAMREYLRLFVLAKPWFLCMLAEAHAVAGQADQGLLAIAEAMEVGAQTGERMWEAESHRVRARLCRQDGRDGAHSHLRRALEVARRQEAKSLELRAALDLGELLRTEGREEKARSLVEGVFGWYSEGLESTDLRRARDFLEQVG